MTDKKMPLIIFDDTGRFGKSPIVANFKKQNLLLKGMLMNAGDVKQAAKYAGIKTMAEAYRTLDQLSLRKGFYESLDNNDITLDFIVKGIKAIATEGDLDSVKLKAFQILLKTLGLENYSEDDKGSKNWEETLLKALESRKDEPKQIGPPQAYEVRKPEVPQTELDKRKKETDLGKELYEQ